MIVESVELKDYRNYEFLDMNFNEHVNIIYGDNAQGKTNILESIYMCSTSKSHRGSKDREIVRFGEDESHIKLNVLKHGMKYRIDMHLKKNKTKGIAVNGIPIKKAVELFGIINIVFFSPEDLNIIKNGPSERRRFIDLIKAFPFTITGMRDFNEAIITKGGVKVSEVNPSTMESKLVPNVYFAGEVVDIDGMCGGYNLQWAWSSGAVAGKAAAREGKIL